MLVRTMAGFEWSPTVPFVPMQPGEDGWCLQDALCGLFRWAPGSSEWSRFDAEGPAGKDIPRLATHLGLTAFVFPDDWNDLIARTAHPGVTLFVFPAYRQCAGLAGH